MGAIICENYYCAYWKESQNQRKESVIILKKGYIKTASEIRGGFYFVLVVV